MDPIEEQQQEIEVLESIYPDEFHKLSDKQFFIVLLLDTESERKYRLKLSVKYPPQYPEELPDLDVTIPTPEEYETSNGEGDDEDYDEEDDDEEDDDNDNGNQAPVPFCEVVEFEPEDLKGLLNKVYDEANENLGMPSVFALASSLKDQAEELFRSKVAQMEKTHDEEMLRQEMEEQKKFHGTKVTRESYLEWRARFIKEMGLDTREEERLKKLHAGRMTGREIFEKGLSGQEDEEVAEITEGVAKVAT